MTILKPIPVKGRDNESLFTLAFELCARAWAQPNNREMHEAFAGAREELKLRLTSPRECDEWVLCSERMPEVDECVLAVDDARLTYLAYLDNGKWYMPSGSVLPDIELSGVIAWQPIPSFPTAKNNLKQIQDGE